MQMIKATRQIIFCFLIMFSCAFAAPARESGKLISYHYLGQFTPEMAKASLQKIPPLNTLEMHYTLSLYKIYYNTPAPDGALTVATGLVAMPDTPQKPVGIVAYLHGTRLLRDDVPSRNNEKNYLYLATFGNSGGYMLAMPDYLGQGDSTLPVHPYVQADTLASSSIDMTIAAKELAQQLQYPLNNKLFIAGYSEGGFTTTVMYESLLKKYPEINITAVSPGSAPYDWNETLRFLIEQPGPRATAYLGLFLYSLQTYQHYWPGMSDIFKKPYDSLIPVLFDGNHTTDEILNALPNDPALIMNEEILAGILNGSDPHSADMQRNMNHYDFVSTAPLLIIGTKGDHDVPFHGSEIAYEVLKNKSDKVFFKSVSDNLDHLQAFPLVTSEQLAFFQRYDGEKQVK